MGRRTIGYNVRLLYRFVDRWHWERLATVADLDIFQLSIDLFRKFAIHAIY